MATAPRINLPDGSGTTTALTMTSNLSGFTFTGEVDSNTVDIQINVNSAGWVSDPALTELALPNFTIPNLSSYPDGLELENGENLIQLRAIDLSGSYSPISTITVFVVPDDDPQFTYVPPTGIRIQRNATSVVVSWSVTQFNIDAGITIGYNVYASTGPGGSQTGYLKLNSEPISVDSPTETSVEDSTDTQQTASWEFVDPLFDDPRLQENRTLRNLLVVNAKLQETTSGLIDPAEETSTIATNAFDVIGSDTFRVDVTITPILVTNTYSFTHNRDDGIGNGVLNSETFAAVSPEEPVYYVVTSLNYVPETGQLIESRYSQEVAGSPLPLDATIRGIRIREQSQVAVDYIKQIQRVKPELALIPGSTVREVHVEPFSNEIQKAYFLMDFIHRAKSFEALLQIDDPGRTGVSVEVSNSSYKQSLRSALSLSSDDAVQALIDGSFDSLASNYGVIRRGSRSAVVMQTFFTRTAPTGDLVINQNAVVTSSTNPTAPRFLANGAAIMIAEDAQSYYNQETQRYEIRIQMIAETTGEDGNVSAGDLDTITAGAPGFETTNMSAASFGRNIASNLELAEDASRKLYSVDAGTPGGYKDTAIGTPGVLEVRVVEAGNEYMMRDWDEVREKHIGGKVDIWVKGTIERTLAESFAFQFDVARSVRFDVIDANNLIFRARDSRLTEDNPIDEMLYNPSQELGLRNQSNSPTTEYDLTGVVIIDYQTIALNTSLPQPETLLDDFIEGDYRFRSNNKFIAAKQPIERVVSVVGEVSGTLDPIEGFDLYKLEDPLLEGNSTDASDYIEIHQVDNIPSGDSIPVSDEQHVLIGAYEEPLGSVGVNEFTLRVYNQERTVEYNGPGTDDPDFLIIEGSQTTPMKIVRSTVTNIPTGATISVDYEHDENFTMTYVINDVLQRVLERVKKNRHTTADVIIKQAFENPLSTETTVQLKANADQATVDSDIRTNITILTDAKGVGEAIHASDMIATIDNTDGVDYLAQPLGKFTLKDGAVRIRDKIVSSGYEFLPSLSQSTNAVYILTQALPFNTSDGGGGSTIHHGVYMDELIMTMAKSLSGVGTGLHKAWIIGRNGAVIEGYSDDATLEPEYITASAIAEARVALTANRVVVSLNYGLTPPDNPSNHTFAATYVVAGSSGVKDINTSEVEYLTPGEVTLTFRSTTGS